MPSDAIKINRPHGERTESNLINSLANSDSSATVTTVSLLPVESFDSNNSLLLLSPPLHMPTLSKKALDKSKAVSHAEDLNEGEGIGDCEENDQDDNNDEEEDEDDFDISIRFDDYQSMDTAEEPTEQMMLKCSKSQQSVISPSQQQSQTFKQQQNSQTYRRFMPTVHLRGSSINTIFQRQNLSGSSSSSSSSSSNRNNNTNNTVSTSSSNSSSNEQRGNLSSQTGRNKHASGDFFYFNSLKQSIFSNVKLN